MDDYSRPMESYQLGEVKATFAGKSGRYIMAGFLALFGGAIILLGLILFISESDPGLLCFSGFGLLMAGLSGFFAVRNFLERDYKVDIHEKGLIQTKRGQQEVIRWDDLKNVWYAVTVYRRYGVKVNTTHTYTVERRSDGKSFKYSDNIKNVEGLGNILQQMSVQVMLPVAVESYNTGGTLTFGKLAVSKAGISDGKQTVPWNEIEKVTINQGAISIKRTGKWLNWKTMTVAQIPNVFVFLELVGAITRKTSG